MSKRAISWQDGVCTGQLGPKFSLARMFVSIFEHELGNAGFIQMAGAF